MTRHTPVWGDVVRAGALTAVCAGVPMVLGGVVTGLGFSWLNPTGTPGKNEQWTSLPTAIGIAVGAVGHLLGHDEWRESGIATRPGRRPGRPRAVAGAHLARGAQAG